MKKYKDNKTEIVPVRFTIAQKLELLKKAEELEYWSLGEYIRAKLGFKDE